MHALNDLLPWLNLLMLPMLHHMVKLEHRLTRIETELRMMLEHSGFAP